LKHPDVVTHCVSMSGAFDIHQFLDGYYDDAYCLQLSAGFSAKPEMTIGL